MSHDVLANTLGQCWSFPPQFSPDQGVTMTAGIQAVLQSLRVLFMTEPGERIMRENWGGGMNDFLFENIADELLISIHNRIEESILRYEPRVVLKDVLIAPDNSRASRLQLQVTVALVGTDIIKVVNGTLDIHDGQALRLR
ncbi:GPW/gp25 family protein [Enterobacteriaceae bacterium LUAb1]